MNQINGGQKEFARVVADNYSMMEEQLSDCVDKNRQLSVENGILLAEVNMLREAVALSQRETLRLQAVASTFGGQARALQSVFSSIVELAIKNGYEAAEQSAPRAQAAPQRSAQEKAPETPEPAQASGAPPQVDWVASGLAKEKFS
jgi:hypothetical protein